MLIFSSRTGRGLCSGHSTRDEQRAALVRPAFYQARIWQAPPEGASAERRKDRRCHQLHLQYCMEEIWQGTWRIDSSRVSKPCFEPSSRKIPSPYEVLIHCLQDLHFSYMHYCVRFRTHRPRTSSPLVFILPHPPYVHISNFQTDSQADRQYQLACCLC
jgi:hypothetical protein